MELSQLSPEQIQQIAKQPLSSEKNSEEVSSKSLQSKSINELQAIASLPLSKEKKQDQQEVIQFSPKNNEELSREMSSGHVQNLPVPKGAMSITDAFISNLGAIETGALDTVLKLGALGNRGMVAAANTLGANLESPDIQQILTTPDLQKKFPENKSINALSTLGSAMPFAFTGGPVSTGVMGAILGASEVSANKKSNALEILGGAATGTLLSGVGYGLGSLMSKMFVDPHSGAIKPLSKLTNEDYSGATRQLLSDIGMPGRKFQSNIETAAKAGLKEAQIGNRDILNRGYKSLYEKPANIQEIVSGLGELNPNQARALQEAMIDIKGSLKISEDPNTYRTIDLIKRDLDSRIGGALKGDKPNYNLVNDLENLKTQILNQVNDPEYNLMRALSADNSKMMDSLIKTPIGKLGEAGSGQKRMWAKNLIESGSDDQFTESMQLLQDPKLKRQLVSEYLQEGLDNLTEKSGTPLDLISGVLNSPQKIRRVNQLLEGDINSQAKLEVLNNLWKSLRPNDPVNANETWNKLTHNYRTLELVTDSNAVKFLQQSFDFITDPKTNRSFRAIINNSNGDMTKIIEDTVKLIKKGRPPDPKAKAGSAIGAITNTNIINNYVERNKE